MKSIQLFFIILGLFLLIQPAYAQTGEKVELEGADNLSGGVDKNGREIRKLIGNVRFRQQKTLLFADSAYLDNSRNFIEFFGNVRILQGDTVTVTGNYGTYDGNSKRAQMRKNVVLTDPTMTLYTDDLDYNMNTNVAFYQNGGRIINDENTLTSQRGYYNTQTKLFTFSKDVKLINPENTLNTDSLQYSSTSKIAYFRAPTKIISKNGTLTSQSGGEYNTSAKASVFRGRSTVEYDKYTLTGDSLFYDEKNKIGIARKNVVLVAKEDSTVIEGDIGRYFGQEGISRVYGNAVMKNIVSGDTLYLTADTLVSIDDKAQGTRKIFAYNHVKIFKSDLQGKADSLVYNFSDSTIQFYRDPVLWNEGSQLLADTIRVQLANNKINKMYLTSNSFVVSQDSLKNYNQLKGRAMVAFFSKDSKIERINVEGNAESIYFALDKGDSLLVGMNKMECGRMVIKFADNKVKSIVAINQPDALFIPPHETEEPAKRLPGFAWRIRERPIKADVMVRSKNHNL